MLETRSATYKMMKTVAHEERRIEKWPPPFLSDATPYSEWDFSNLVRNACSKRTLTLRISKIIVIGDVAVGKTSLVNRFCHKNFDNNYKATIGVDFEVERFDILGTPFNLQIWDTAGQERFKCIAASYYRGANVIMIVFDLGSLMSLSHCQQWYNEAKRSNSGQCHVFLVGTKRDLLSREVYEIIERRARTVAEKLSAEFWAVSSRTGDGVPELFARIAGLSFNATVLKELEGSSKMEPIGIGSDVVSLQRRPQTISTKDQNRIPKCSNCIN